MNSLDLAIVFLKNIQTPVWKTSYSSNALVSSPSTYRETLLIPVSLTKPARKAVEMEDLPGQNDPQQPPQEITDYSHGYGYI